jgi:hypothetical protein
MRYIDSDTLAEARNALRQGVRLELLASRLQLRPNELARLLGLPVGGSSPAADEAGETDLWAGCERLDGIL